MIKIDANDLKKLILNVELIKEFLLSRELHRGSDGELTDWAKRELEEASNFPKDIKEDLEFARRTEEAWKSYDRGKFKTYSEKEFLKKLEE